MRFERVLVLAFAVAGSSAACAAGATGGATAKPTASGLPQVTCAGVTPGASALTAQGALNRTLIPGMRAETAAPFYQQALTAAQQDLANPFNVFITGEAYAGMGRLPQADSAFTRTVQLCAGFAGEVADARRAAYGTAFNAGVAALNANDTATAITQFTRAAGIYDGGADALFNLGLLYGNTGDAAHAVQYYRQALTALRTQQDTTEAARSQAVVTRANALLGLLGAGTTYFQKDQFAPAADVFRTVTAADPNNRDAWYNLGLALYKQNRWADLVPVAQRIIQLDPLNYNAHIVLFNAYKGLADAAGNNRSDPNRQNALSTLSAADALPVQVEGVRMDNSTAGSVKLVGTVVGAKAPAGRPVTLEFTAYGATGRLGSQTVTVNAPAKDQKSSFELTVPSAVPATSFSYRLVP